MKNSRDFLQSILEKKDIHIVVMDTPKEYADLGWRMVQLTIQNDSCLLAVDDEYEDVHYADDVLLYLVVLFTLDGYLPSEVEWMQQAGLSSSATSGKIWKMLARAYELYMHHMKAIDFPCSTLDWETNAGLAQEARLHARKKSPKSI